MYDRHLDEMAVSYQLFSLYVHPAELAGRNQVAEALAGILAEEKDKLRELLKKPQRIIQLADDIDEQQAKAISRLHLQGVYCRPREERFYPAHTVAAHVLGFTGDGVGLAGVEGKYDLVLQPGEFRNSDVPEIDFSDQKILGRTTTDLVLSLDLGVQKKIEARLRELLRSRVSRRGMALLLDPGSGRILAMASHPAFNPNYFWQADEASRSNRLLRDQLDVALIRPLLVRAAAVVRQGSLGGPLLPCTVAAPDFGLTEEDIRKYETQLGLHQPIGRDLRLPVSGGTTQSSGIGADTVNGVQMGVALASLVNGGWRIEPYLLDAIYDHSTHHRYLRARESTGRELVFQPAMGVRLRRELLQVVEAKKDAPLVFAGSSVRLVRDGRWSRYSMQQIMVGLYPAKAPKLLLLMAVEQDTLFPLVKKQAGNEKSLAAMGRSLMPVLFRQVEKDVVAGIPGSRNKENFHQFLISRRIDYQEQPAGMEEDTFTMPDLVGFSLRKGLQRLNRQKVRVRIRGTGQIVSQQPAAGTSFDHVTDCVLTLQSKRLMMP